MVSCDYLNFRSLKFIAILIVFISCDLFGQTFVEQNLPELKSGWKILTISGKFITRASDNFGERFSLSFLKRQDSPFNFSFDAGDFEHYIQVVEKGIVTDSLLNALIQLEIYYKSNSKIFEGWVSYWQLTLECSRNSGSSLRKETKNIRCTDEQFLTFLEALSPGLSKKWKKA